MKLFQQLLVAPAALGLLAPVAAGAAELNMAGVSQYSSSEQVTSISQFSDVKPTDWAYQALSNLIERYGCVAGYPNGTYKGGQAMTRFEAAALLNACLDRVTEVTDELKKLMKEFEKELAILKGRVDGLEARVGELEANQFSTTTKLKGIATFVMGANSYSGSNTGAVNFIKANQGATTFNYDVRLNFDTSFTGKDLLRTTLRAGNFGNTAYANGLLPNNSLEVAFQESEAGSNIVGINRLFYQFPVGKDFTVTVGGRVRQDDMLAMWPSAYPADTVLDFFTYAGSPAAYSLNLGAGAGIYYKKNNWNASINYVSQNAQNGSPTTNPAIIPGEPCGGIGTDCSAQTFTAQLGYAASNWGAAVAYTYGAGTTIPAGTILASSGNFNGFSDLNGVNTNTIGLSAYWQPSTSGWVPSISTGWGITGVSGGDSSLTVASESLSGTRIQSWYVGLQWADAFIKGNALGMAVGQTPFVTSNPSSVGGNPNDGNYAWEWWYKFQVTDNISVTPAIYYLSQTAGQVGKTNFATGGAATVNNFGGLIKTTFKF
ncbi:iron uptake porin [Synechococcus sp. FGCU-3]|nr:iron uptake porin [Synechococcus sp. FGCU3]